MCKTLKMKIKVFKKVYIKARVQKWESFILTASEQESFQTCKNKIQLRKKRKIKKVKNAGEQTENRPVFVSSVTSLKEVTCVLTCCSTWCHYGQSLICQRSESAESILWREWTHMLSKLQWGSTCDIGERGRDRI